MSDLCGNEIDKPVDILIDTDSASDCSQIELFPITSVNLRNEAVMVKIILKH